MRKEDFVSLDVTRLLKECKMEIPTYFFRAAKDTDNCDIGDLLHKNNKHIQYFNKQYLFPAPTLYEVQKLLREQYNIHITIGNSASGYWWELSKADNGTTIYDYNYSGPNDGGKWDCYEDALDSAILTVLNSKLIKKTKQK